MSKKIGILTFHRAINHGAVLQCYALYKTLEKLGYDVKVVDYRQSYIEDIYKSIRHPFSMNEFKSILSRPRWIPGYLFKVLPQSYKRKRLFNRFNRLYKKLKYTLTANSAKEIPTNLDTIIIGSDQVWANYCTGGMDKVYYGEFPHEQTKIIGYAISSELNSLKENGSTRLKEVCKNFSAISFREEDISRYLQETINLKSKVVLDPTLLLNRKEWDNVINVVHMSKQNDYVLTHFLNSEFEMETLDKQLASFAKKERCNIVKLEEVARSPEEFILWIKNARYIITSSFHATVFSIIYNKKFLSLRTNNGKDIRYISLLEKLGLSSQLIEYYNINTVDTKYINYNQANQTLRKEIEYSILYLTNNL